VPAPVVQGLSRIAGSAVVSGETVYGGHSASASYKILLADGRHVFAKGNHPAEMAHGTQNLRQEIEVYQSGCIAGFAPRYLGVAGDGDEDGWMLGVWEYIPHGADVALEQAIAALKTAHSTTPFPSLPQCRQRSYISQYFDTQRKWKRIRDEEQARARFAALLDAPDDFIGANIPRLVALQERLPEACGAAMLHGDLRMDNVFNDVDGKTYIVDWPNACTGPAAFDVLHLGASLGRIGDAVALYGGLDQDQLSIIAAGMAGLLADHAGRAVPAKLPRLRQMQRGMLASLIEFLERVDKIDSLARIRI
jgi:fructosamine-3-kinase